MTTPQIGPIPGNFTPAVLKKLFLAIQNIFETFSGEYLKDGTVRYTKLNLAKGDIPTGKINWGEWHIPLALPAADVTTTSTSAVRCSGVFCWDPAVFPTSGGNWHLEAYLAISSGAGTVTCRLMNATTGAEVGSVAHTGDTNLTPKRSGVLTMPASSANLYVDFRSSSGSYTARFSGAKLVWVPG